MPRTSAIIAAKRRLSTDFAIVVSFDVKEAAVSARLPRPETALGAPEICPWVCVSLLACWPSERTSLLRRLLFLRRQVWEHERGTHRRRHWAIGALHGSPDHLVENKIVDLVLLREIPRLGQ